MSGIKEGVMEKYQLKSPLPPRKFKECPLITIEACSGFMPEAVIKRVKFGLTAASMADIRTVLHNFHFTKYSYINCGIKGIINVMIFLKEELMYSPTGQCSVHQFESIGYHFSCLF